MNVDRQKLRRLEVALMEYRESLEERGIKNPEEIERKVDIQRKRLESEYGLHDYTGDASGKSKSLLLSLVYFCFYFPFTCISLQSFLNLGAS